MTYEDGKDKFPCGHAKVVSASVFYCTPCDDERPAREAQAMRDKEWNAAIEAAAAKCASEEANYDDVGEQCALRNAAEAIRALKREAK